MLHASRAAAADMARAVVSRVKILAGLNIAERRLPQDGRARVTVGRHELDLRVATMPTMHGEAVVIRVLRAQPARCSISPSSASPAATQRRSAEHLAAPHGLILVTGPTGSGKTTTLAAALTHAQRSRTARSSPSRIRSSTRSRASTRPR